MTRSDSVRREVLERDDYRCQITGFDGRDEKDRQFLQVHHVVALGMGGSEAKDTVENGITVYHEVHLWLHAGALVIARWERPWIGEEMVEEPVFVDETETVHHPGALEVIDNQDVLGGGIGKVAHERLWFYRRQKAEELAPVEARIQGLHMIDGSVACDLWRLWKDDAFKALDPDAKSFKQYAAARGWDVGKALSMAELYEDATTAKVDWGAGQTAAEVRRALRERGLLKKRVEWHLAFRDHETVQFLLDTNAMELVRCTSDKFAEDTRPGVEAHKLHMFPGS